MRGWPLAITPTRHALRVTGMDPGFLDHILTTSCGPSWRQGKRLQAKPCTCSTKSALVPAAHTHCWDAVLQRATLAPATCSPTG
eukprot:10290890-Prorocentrum_lima.AAC.1